MNLVEVEIEDYRQFHGITTFSPAQQAMIGIIGENGAGKTTLFEAIEWCLYNPSSIRNDDIRPRMLGGHPRVKVTLEDAQSGEQYEVERELKGRTVSAAIYRATQPEMPIVQGTKQVTDYVAKTMLGLSHQAFVATFFTRQQELNFFGSMGATDRRREVGKLLGLETIRIAQQSISQQRQEKQSEARQRKQIYDDQSTGRDFAADRIAAQTLIEQRTREAEASSDQLKLAADELAAARKQLQGENQRAADHHVLRLEESTLQGTRLRNLAEIDSIKAQIGEIDSAEGQIATLEPAASTVTQLQKRLQEHERTRIVADQIAETGRRLEALKKSRQSLSLSITEVASKVESAGVRRVSESETFDEATEIERLLVITTIADAAGKQALLSALERCEELSTTAAADQTRLQTYRERAGQIEKDIKQIRAVGDPADEVAAAVSLVTTARNEESAQRAAIASEEQQRRQLDSLRKRLESGEFDQPCPTCGRPYEPEELEQDLLVLRTQVEHLSGLIRERTGKLDETARRAVIAEQQEIVARERMKELSHFESRLAQSKPHIDEARLSCEQSSSALAAAIAAANLKGLPTQTDIDIARSQLQNARRLEHETPLLEKLRRDLQINSEQIETTGTELSNLGISAYDRAAHATDTETWRKASDAAAQITILQQRVASRPSVMERLTDVERIRLEIADQIEAKQTSLNELAFSPDVQTVAQVTEQETRERYEALLSGQHEAKSLLASAIYALQVIEAEETRLQEMLKASIEAQLAADEFDRMYREFSRFEQHVARAVTPALAEITSQLVSAVTEGKYDRVEFSEDFGIEVYDGDDDHFPLSQFSGGERDVIALSARLALSQFLGGQSGLPPQFVVMDEVFGSLDKSRRENLMETLNRLVDETGTFKQLFVISHVDDVRASAAFDEVWRVEEGPDGVSQLELLSSNSIPEDL